MEISKFKIAFKFLFGGGVSGVVEYLLDLLKTAVASLSDLTKAKIQAALNFAKKVLSILKTIRFLIPTKWQTAYDQTILAVEEIVDDLSDLELTKEELDKIVDKVNAAIAAWKSDDDETCVDTKALKA